MNIESALAPKLKEPGFWREMWQQARLVFYLMRDPEVPFYLKLLPFAAIAYLIFPFDLIPDLAPVIGQLDDITALLVGAKVFIELAPPHVVARHMQRIRELDGFVITNPAEHLNEVTDAIIIDIEHEVVIENEKDRE